MKILSFNVGYLLGFQSQREWLRRPHRLCIGNRSVEKQGLETVVELLRREQPDVAALQDLDPGSLRARFSNQCGPLLDRLSEAGLEYKHRADTKYGQENLTAKLPILQNMSNALLWNSTDGAENDRAVYLSSGTKRLVHILERSEDPSVIAVHLSKTRGTRKEQLRELRTMQEGLDPVILAGDFNVKDPSEFSVLTDDAGLELHSPGKSFSTAYPSYAFDVFLTSEGLSINRCEVLTDVTISDHMPVVAEINVS